MLRPFQTDTLYYRQKLRIEDMIDEVKMSLPQTLILEIECEPEDLEDCITDAISDETGWLVEYFSYEILEEE